MIRFKRVFQGYKEPGIAFGERIGKIILFLASRVTLFPKKSLKYPASNIFNY